MTSPNRSRLIALALLVLSASWSQADDKAPKAKPAAEAEGSGPSRRSRARVAPRADGRGQRGERTSADFLLAARRSPRARKSSWPRRRCALISPSIRGRPTQAIPGPTGVKDRSPTANTIRPSATIWPPQGNAFVYEYNPETKTFRTLTDVELLKMPDGHYTPGKIHSRVEKGSDGWLYFTTHRGSTKVTTDANHFKGDWILLSRSARGKSEIVAHGPVSKHCLPTGMLDAERLIYYASTAPGQEDSPDGVRFLAYDLRGRTCSTPGRMDRRER